MAKYWFEKWSTKFGEVLVQTTSVSVSSQIGADAQKYARARTNLSQGYYSANGYSIISKNESYLYPMKIEGSGNHITSQQKAKCVHTETINRNFDAEIYMIEKVKNALVENIIADETEYPANGIQGDYWYVKGEKAFPSLKIQGIGNISGAKLKDSTGQIRNVGNVYFKDSNGLVRNLK